MPDISEIMPLNVELWLPNHQRFNAITVGNETLETIELSTAKWSLYGR